MPNDYRLLAVKESIWAEMLLDVLKDNNIPCTALPVHGAGMVLKGGVVEELKIYVPANWFARAEELRDILFSNQASLFTEMLTLIPITDPSDFAYFSQLIFHETVMKMNMGRVFTQEEAEGYFFHILNYRKIHPDSGTHMVYRGETFIGIASLWENEAEAEVEYMLLPEYWNRGYATEVVGLLEEKAAALPHITLLKGLTDPANIPSQKVLLKNGFVFSKAETLEDGSQIHIFTKSSKGKE